MAELRFSHYTLHQQPDPLIALQAFVENHIATYKEKVFGTFATPVDSSQNVHVLNYRKFEMRCELGYNFNFKAAIGKMAHDPFTGCAWNILDIIYRVFTPSRVIDPLTHVINDNKEKPCEAFKYLALLEIDEGLKKQMFNSENDDIFYAESITTQFTEHYLNDLNNIQKGNVSCIRRFCTCCCT